VLKAQAFEGLLTLVPILLVAVVSILLRSRAARRQKQREEATRSTQEPASGKPAARSRSAPQAQPRPTSRPPDYSRRGETAGQKPAPSPRFTPEQPRQAPMAARESYAYPTPLSLNHLKSPAVADADAGLPAGTPMRQPSGRIRRDRQSLQQRMESLGIRERVVSRPAAGERVSIPARLERLPPLKRAVIWAEILGPPGGRQQ
jgi:hypothetical protein